jgi:hypothetical protein
MADNPDALRVAIDGGMAVIAPLGTTAPTGLAAWGSGWRRLGLIADSGVTESSETERTERRPWGYKSPVRTDITTVSYTVAFTCWETNPYTLALHSGQPLSGFSSLSGGVVHQAVRRPSGQQLYMLGIDEFDGDNHIRTVIPRAEVTQPGEVVKNAEEVRGYPLTWTAYELSDGHLFDRYLLCDGMFVPMQSIEVSGTATVAVAATTVLTAEATGYGNDAEVTDVTATATWETSDPAVATVSGGTVTGVSAGTATISASIGGAVGTLEVTVTA